eukprot:13284559-Alexandrium_andersonii.AAC.1
MCIRDRRSPLGKDRLRRNVAPPLGKGLPLAQRQLHPWAGFACGATPLPPLEKVRSWRVAAPT